MTTTTDMKLNWPEVFALAKTSSRDAYTIATQGASFKRILAFPQCFGPEEVRDAVPFSVVARFLFLRKAQEEGTFEAARPVTEYGLIAEVLGIPVKVFCLGRVKRGLDMAPAGVWVGPWTQLGENVRGATRTIGGEPWDFLFVNEKLEEATRTMILVPHGTVDFSS